MSANPADPGVPGISVLGTAQRAAWLEKTLPPVERLAGGLWSVPVPIPDNPLRYTLSYLVPGDDGLVVVDPGWNADETWTALLAGLAEAGATPKDITGIVVTHVHPDHHGLSARLRDESGAWVAMHPAERDTLRVTGSGGSSPTAEGWLRLAGADDAEVTELVASLDGAGNRDRPAMAEPDVLLEDGDLVPMAGRTLRAVWTPGHTPGHLCLQEPDARLLLTGDHVLPRITPNIGLYPNSAESPLARFLESLEKIRAYDDHDALPAHEYRFRGLDARAGYLAEHHEQRCRELVAVVEDLDEPVVWSVAKNLSWSRPWEQIGHMRFGALAETGAHIEHLVRRGELAWRRDEKDRPVRVRSAR
ncbi:MBL fold metallo-hydrolase [Prauserella cavernicola]|uniref:MBL fold metallo-hydrolase n=1 Tax=Prauserella cavernicola TaxID=2800127 RepID=A0A934V7Y9_9PSEU|nr:MBL fold metallo-hydrolase [Prauserella cavernicola]MBK1789102.1 MBL fold metallo-hydrolase [Prauserella cavernicola]